MPGPFRTTLRFMRMILTSPPLSLGICWIWAKRSKLLKTLDRRLEHTPTLMSALTLLLEVRVAFSQPSRGDWMVLLADPCESLFVERCGNRAHARVSDDIVLRGG